MIRFIVVLYLVGALAMIAYPPWVARYQPRPGSAAISRPIRYAPLVNPPAPRDAALDALSHQQPGTLDLVEVRAEEYVASMVEVRLDVPRLTLALLGWAVAVMLFAIVWPVLTRVPARSEGSKQTPP